MGTAIHHAISSAKKFGGTYHPFLKVHDFFDSTKISYASWKHRVILHNAFGIDLAIQVFGPIIINSEGKKIPTRLIAEQHIREDLGTIPSIQDWLKNLSHEKWMTRETLKLDTE